MESHSWLIKSDQTAFCWVLLALYGGAFAVIRGGQGRSVRGGVGGCDTPPVLVR
jgi:hypothetical protein